MADIKISELGSAAVVNDTDVIPMTASGVTVKATAALLKNYMGVGSLSSLTTDDKTSLANSINEVDAHADAAQASANNAQQMIAIVESGNTCTHTGGIGQGKYVAWKGELYTADNNIAVGTTFASSGGGKNLTAVSNGGLNNQIKIRKLSSSIIMPSTQTGGGLYKYIYNYASSIQDILNNHTFVTAISTIRYGNEDYSNGWIYLIDDIINRQALVICNDVNHNIGIDVNVFYI